MKTKQSGFTIIEVVLVLAIAGLIFVIVFYALPQLQKSRRDTQRRDDVGKVVGAVLDYASNHNTQLPTDQTAADELKNIYLNSLTAPSGTTYAITYQTTAPEADIFSYHDSARCNNDGTLANTGTSKQFAVSVKLEAGGYYCQEN